MNVTWRTAPRTRCTKCTSYTSGMPYIIEKTDPVKVELTPGPADVPCKVVHSDGTVDAIELKSANLRGAMREVTARMAGVGYEPRGRWSEGDGVWWRAFKTWDIEDVRASHRKARRAAERWHITARSVDMDGIDPEDRRKLSEQLFDYEDLEQAERVALQQFVQGADLRSPAAIVDASEVALRALRLGVLEESDEQATEGDWADLHDYLAGHTGRSLCDLVQIMALIAGPYIAERIEAEGLTVDEWLKQSADAWRRATDTDD